VRAASSSLTRRLSVLAIGLTGAVVVASSCSFDAAVTTDRAGLVLAVNAVRIQSTVQELGLAMLVSGRELVVEFRWGRALLQRRV
jgi:hypothetical protein